jgi:hypothetical protein
MKTKCWTLPKQFKPPTKSEDVVTIPAEHVIPFGLTTLLISWLKNQRAAEMTMDSKLFPIDVQEYLSKKTSTGCGFPPCRGFCPDSQITAIAC